MVLRKQKNLRAKKQIDDRVLAAYQLGLNDYAEKNQFKVFLLFAICTLFGFALGVLGMWLA